MYVHRNECVVWRDYVYIYMYTIIMLWGGYD